MILTVINIYIFCHIEKRQRSNWFRHWSVSCKLIFASGLFSSVRVSLGWIHYNYKLCKEFIFSGYWDWPQGILRSQLTFVKHAAGTQSGRLLEQTFCLKKKEKNEEKNNLKLVCLFDFFWGGEGLWGELILYLIFRFNQA